MHDHCTCTYASVLAHMVEIARLSGVQRKPYDHSDTQVVSIDTSTLKDNVLRQRDDRRPTLRTTGQIGLKVQPLTNTP